jgi:peptidoglycan hydrolase CwlO-like protein
MNPIAPTFRLPTSLSCFSIPSIHKVISAAAIITAVAGVAAAIFSSQMFIAIGFAILGVSAAYHAAAVWKKPVVEVPAPQALALQAPNAQLVALQAELDRIQGALGALQVERDQHAAEIEELRAERAPGADAGAAGRSLLDQVHAAIAVVTQLGVEEGRKQIRPEIRALLGSVFRAMQSSIREKFEAARNKIAALEDTIRDLEGQLQAAKEEIANLRQPDDRIFAEMDNRVAEMHTTIAEMHTTIQDLQRENVRLRERENLHASAPGPERPQT